MPVGSMRVWAIIIVACVLNLFSINASAQDAAGAVMSDEAVLLEPAAAAEPVNPIIAVEQELALGEGSPAGPVPGTSVLGLLRMLLTLAVVAAAIYGVVFLFKRMARGGGKRDPYLKILAGVSLGVNRHAHIIAVGSRAWLVGSAENGVSLIAEIEDTDILNAMFLEDSQKNAVASTDAGGSRFPDFKTLLRRLGVPADSKAPTPEDIRKRRERLKGM